MSCNGVTILSCKEREANKILWIFFFHFIIVIHSSGKYQKTIILKESTNCSKHLHFCSIYSNSLWTRTHFHHDFVIDVYRWVIRHRRSFEGCIWGFHCVTKTVPYFTGHWAFLGMGVIRSDPFFGKTVLKILRWMECQKDRLTAVVLFGKRLWYSGKWC